MHVYRPDVVSQAVSFWRAVQTRVWRGRPDPVRDARAEYHAGAIAHVVTMLREQEKGWRAWFDEENIEPIDVAYPVLWRNLTQVVGTVLEALGLDPRLAPPPVLERQADQRSDEWVDRYRADAEREGLPHMTTVTIRRHSTSTSCGCSRPRPCTSSARWSPNCSGRCCCSRRARTPSCCFGWRRRLFGPRRCRSRCMHVDTGHNFGEVIEFRDRRVTGHGHKLIVASVQESIDSGRVADPGPGASRNRQQTRTLLDALEAGGFDAAFGGARRDEERARAKERILSFRDEFGQWDPRAQRPEPWSLYNGRIKKGEQVRVFPLSNWTELDIWRYIELEGLELPSIYFAHEREVFERDGILLAVSEYAAAGQRGERRRSNGCATAPSAT